MQSFKEKKLVSDMRVYKSAWAREWRKNNPERAKELDQKWAEKYRERRWEYAQKNKERHALYSREIYQRVEGIREKSTINARERYRRRKRTPREKIDQNLSVSVRQALRGKKAGRSWEVLVGYTVGDLFERLESLFDKYMSWENYGTYWHIDHIKPKSLFKYETAEELEFKECWSLDNLQPMEKIANIKKGSKYEG